MGLVRRVGQAALGVVFVTGGAETLRNPEPRVKKAAALGIGAKLGADDATLVRANAVAMVAGGLALVTDTLPRLAAFGLAASLVPTTVAGHRFWEEADPVARANHRVHFAKNVSIAGGCLLLAASKRRKPLRRTARDAARGAASHVPGRG